MKYLIESCGLRRKEKKKDLWYIDLCIELLRDGLKFVFSPDISFVADWAQSTN